jgi:hypothetical protein
MEPTLTEATHPGATDFFQEALQNFGDLDGQPKSMSSEASSTPFLLSFSSIYAAICGSEELLHEEETLLLYLLVTRNAQFDHYLNSRADDLDQLMLPVLEMLHRKSEYSNYQIHTLLATLLVMTEMPDFSSCMYSSIVREVLWFDGPRSLKNVSVGDLIFIVLLQMCLRNLVTETVRAPEAAHFISHHLGRFALSVRRSQDVLLLVIANLICPFASCDSVHSV